MSTILGIIVLAAVTGVAAAWLFKKVFDDGS
jgi:hypothetical protein